MLELGFFLINIKNNFQVNNYSLLLPKRRYVLILNAPMIKRD